MAVIFTLFGFEEVGLDGLRTSTDVRYKLIDREFVGISMQKKTEKKSDLKTQFHMGRRNQDRSTRGITLSEADEKDSFSHAG